MIKYSGKGFAQYCVYPGGRTEEYSSTAGAACTSNVDYQYVINLTDEEISVDQQWVVPAK
ncbi:MAG: hypothetical protein IPI73_30270 [Betaproteobacteria bacterium]|nr:hypothetical protein [Betaproteobacteria bacterium]